MKSLSATTFQMLLKLRFAFIVMSTWILSLVSSSLSPVPSPPRTLCSRWPALLITNTRWSENLRASYRSSPCAFTLAHTTKAFAFCILWWNRAWEMGETNILCSPAPLHRVSGSSLQMKTRNHHRPYVLHCIPSALAFTNCLSFPRYPAI